MSTPLGDLRELVAGALVPLDVGEVHDAPVDAITPPAFVLVWPDPWLVPSTSCYYDATLDVICAAARIDPAPGYVELELMVAGALPALRELGLGATVSGAAPFDCGGLHYQSARVRIVQPVQL